MKDKFRIVFEAAEAGWIIQHSRLGLLWKTVGNTVFRMKQDAEEFRLSLQSGHTPEPLFSTTEEDKGD